MKAPYFLVVVGIAFVSLAFAQEDGEEVAKAIRAIEEKGGRILKDQDSPGKPVVEAGFLYSETVKDDDLVNLKPFRMLKRLHFIGIAIKSKGFLRLDGFAHLEGLDLMDMKIDDEALKWVAKNKELRILCLSYTCNITDKGLGYISGLQSLEELSLYETKVTDAGLTQLKEMKRLRRLHLGKTAVTDAGVATLNKALPNLIIFR